MYIYSQHPYCCVNKIVLTFAEIIKIVCPVMFTQCVPFARSSINELYTRSIVDQNYSDLSTLDCFC